MRLIQVFRLLTVILCMSVFVVMFYNKQFGWLMWINLVCAFLNTYFYELDNKGE